MYLGFLTLDQINIYNTPLKKHTPKNLKTNKQTKKSIFNILNILD